MPWYEVREHHHRLKTGAPGTLAQSIAFEAANNDGAIQDAMRQDLAVRDEGFVVLYDHKNVKIWPAKAPDA